MFHNAIICAPSFKMVSAYSTVSFGGTSGVGVGFTVDKAMEGGGHLLTADGVPTV